jgi:hypothetical protein
VRITFSPSFPQRALIYDTQKTPKIQFPLKNPQKEAGKPTLTMRARHSSIIARYPEFCRVMSRAHDLLVILLVSVSIDLLSAFLSEEPGVPLHIFIYWSGHASSVDIRLSFWIDYRIPHFRPRIFLDCD